MDKVNKTSNWLTIKKENGIYTNNKNQVIIIIPNTNKEKKYLKFWLECKFIKFNHNNLSICIKDKWEYLHVISNSAIQDKENDSMVKIDGKSLKQLIRDYQTL